MPLNFSLGLYFIPRIRNLTVFRPEKINALRSPIFKFTLLYFISGDFTMKYSNKPIFFYKHD